MCGQVGRGHILFNIEQVMSFLLKVFSCKKQEIFLDSNQIAKKREAGVLSIREMWRHSLIFSEPPVFDIQTPDVFC